MPPEKSKQAAGSWLKIAVTLIVVLGLPALWRWGNLVRYSFDESAIRALEVSKPKYVFVGDSMLQTRLDPERLSQVADIRCDVLAYPGSSSAVWFLVVKNIVGALSQPPQRVILFFRDRQLTLPAQRTEGRYRNGLEAFMRGPEPLFEKTLAAAIHHKTPAIERFLLLAYPVQNHRRECQEELQETALNLVANRRTKPLVQDALREIFDLKHLRGDGPPPESQEDDRDRLNPDNVDFAPSVQGSFLPLMIEAAERRHIQMVFFRVKCRPHAGHVVDPDRPSLQQYERDLRAYIAEPRRDFAR